MEMMLVPGSRFLCPACPPRWLWEVLDAGTSVLIGRGAARGIPKSREADCLQRRRPACALPTHRTQAVRGHSFSPHPSCTTTPASLCNCYRISITSISLHPYPHI